MDLEYEPGDFVLNQPRPNRMACYTNSLDVQSTKIVLLVMFFFKMDNN